MYRYNLLIFISLFISLDVVYSQLQSCTYTSSYGSKYDFTSMANKTSYSYSLNDGSTIIWNVCNTASACINNDLNKNTTSCLRSRTNSWFIYGLSQTGAFSDLEKGVDGAVLTYNNPGKQSCPNATFEYPTTQIQLVCTRGQNTAVISANTDSVEKCLYAITMGSDQACALPQGKNNRLGGGWIFVIIFISFIFVYFVGGSIYCSITKSENKIPHQQFWIAVPALIKDGYIFVTSCGKNRNGYQPVQSGFV